MLICAPDSFKYQQCKFEMDALDLSAPPKNSVLSAYNQWDTETESAKLMNLL